MFFSDDVDDNTEAVMTGVRSSSSSSSRGGGCVTEEFVIVRGG